MHIYIYIYIYIYSEASGVLTKLRTTREVVRDVVQPETLETRSITCIHVYAQMRLVMLIITVLLFDYVYIYIYIYIHIHTYNMICYIIL